MCLRGWVLGCVDGAGWVLIDGARVRVRVCVRSYARALCVCIFICHNLVTCTYVCPAVGSCGRTN